MHVLLKSAMYDYTQTAQPSCTHPHPKKQSREESALCCHFNAWHNVFCKRTLLHNLGKALSVHSIHLFVLVFRVELRERERERVGVCVWLCVCACESVHVTVCM